MLKIITTGYDGKMGRLLSDVIREDENLDLICVCARGLNIVKNGLKIYDNMDKIYENADVVIDFSHQMNLDNVLSYSLRTKTPLVLATTGYNELDFKKIHEASRVVPIFQSYNMSLGVNVLIKLVKEASKALDGFDIEIIEKHHNRKIDAPSGTAIMIAEKIKKIKKESNFVYGRFGNNSKREKNDIGIHAIRGGNIVGEHDVIFAGDSEILTINHSAESRRIFANGSISAANFLVKQVPGLYSMDDMLNI